MRYLQKNPKTVKAKLDEKDRKILAYLSANAKMPSTQLAKKAGLSRDAVAYRIRNYEKQGIIQGYRTMVDISKFGYQAHHLLIKLNNPSEDIEQRIIDRLVKNPYVRAIIKFSGNFDFEIAFVARDVEELDKVLTKIVNDCSGFLQDYEILTISKVFVAETFPPNFSGYPLEAHKGIKKQFMPDKKDIEILKIISEDALMPLYDIASKVRLSADAVAYRIKNMAAAGLIIKFVPVVNYTSLDYNLYTILLNISGLDEEKEKTLKEFLSRDKNTLWAVKTIGRFNVLIYLLVKDLEDLQKTVLELRSLFPKQINHYETLIAYEEYKYIYFPKDIF